MAGLLDDVMDGIAAKEKQAQTTTPTTPQTPASTPTHEQTPTATSETKPMNNYSDQFNDRYGERKAE